MGDEKTRFEAGGVDYARFRPSYPDNLVARLATAISSVVAPAAAPVLDVGAGTGIFTRQLMRQLGDAVPVVGIEPAAGMREVAQNGPAHFRLIEGSAESLPAASGSVRAVTAATAAHWFNRPLFYGEAERVLTRGGVLALIEYVRDTENSPAAQAVAEFLDHHGDQRTVVRADYAIELAALAGFGAVTAITQPETLGLSVPDFVGLALSSSHARAALQRLGRAGAEAELTRIAAGLCDPAGVVPFGYRFQLAFVRRSD